MSGLRNYARNLETAFENKRGIGDELVPLEVGKELPRRIEKLVGVVTG